MKTNIINHTEQTITSLEIAELTGKQHKDVLKAIRNMEPAWEKVHGRKFALMFREVKIGNGAVRRDPCYQLTKTECLYIATKFNDEARAKLVLRWEELGMRDGNLYMTEKPKRHKNKPIFRDDNCSLSHGHNGKYYFVFTMDDDRLGELPQQLVQQAGNIARKVMREIFEKEVFGEVRTMTNEKGEPFFVGSDIARALGYKN